MDIVLWLSSLLLHVLLIFFAVDGYNVQPPRASPSLKELYREARVDIQKLPIAKKAALASISEMATITTAKEAMNIISILKLSNDASDVLQAAKLVLHDTDSDNPNPLRVDLDTQIFNNLLDGCARVGDELLVRV